MATDLAVTALAERARLEPEAADDTVLRLLETWAADIDAHPVAVQADALNVVPTRRRPRGTARSIAAMTIALTLSSTGFAAAVQGNPFGPINYMVDKFGHLAHHDRTSPVDLLGTRETVRGGLHQKQARDRVEAGGRPSRGVPADRPARRAQPDLQATAPIESHEVRSAPADSSAADDVQKPRDRHRHLVVRHPHRHPVVDNPKPGGGETPPNRPEPPAGQSVPTWPMPTTGEQPAPPDKPMSSDPEPAPVR
jgi:hypothetical protein